MGLGQSEILGGERLSFNASSEESKTGLREKQAEDKERPCGISSPGFLDSSGQKFPFLPKLVSVSPNPYSLTTVLIITANVLSVYCVLGTARI